MRARQRRWRRRLGFVAALAVIAVAWIYGPDTVRQIDALRVREVEVVGTRFLDPYSVVRAAGLDRPASLFDDADAWRAGIRTLPLVDDVHVRRVYPATVRLEVREVEPVALVAAETLRPVDATGRLLELEPAGQALDLPVLTGLELAGTRAAAGASTSAVATVAALLGRAPDVAERLSEVELRGDELRLGFRHAGAKALLPIPATPIQLNQLRLALADLRARGELEQVRTIDVRFRDQVVVSFLDRP